jgi:hypothetical protein
MDAQGSAARMRKVYIQTDEVLMNTKLALALLSVGCAAAMSLAQPAKADSFAVGYHSGWHHHGGYSVAVGVGPGYYGGGYYAPGPAYYRGSPYCYANGYYYQCPAYPAYYAYPGYYGPSISLGYYGGGYGRGGWWDGGHHWHDGGGHWNGGGGHWGGGNWHH